MLHIERPLRRSLRRPLPEVVKVRRKPLVPIVRPVQRHRVTLIPFPSTLVNLLLPLFRVHLTGDPPEDLRLGVAEVESNVICERRDVCAVPRVDLDHVRCVGIAEQQSPSQSVVRFGPRMITGVEPLLRLYVESPRIHPQCAHVTPYWLSDAVIRRPGRVRRLGTCNHARVLLDTVERLPMMGGPSRLITSIPLTIKNRHPLSTP